MAKVPKLSPEEKERLEGEYQNFYDGVFCNGDIYPDPHPAETLMALGESRKVYKVYCEAE